MLNDKIQFYNFNFITVKYLDNQYNIQFKNKTVGLNTMYFNNLSQFILSTLMKLAEFTHFEFKKDLICLILHIVKNL